MSVKDLSVGDFDFYKKYVDKMRVTHDREFMCRIDPDLMRCYYRGMNEKYKEDSSRGYNDHQERDFYNDPSNYMTLSRMFQATNTILPNLYYQNPAPIVIPTKAEAESAALMSALIKHYMKLNGAKRQNQEAVMNTWFFGIGWKKLGYRTVFFPRENVAGEPESILDKLKGGFNNLLGNPIGNQTGKPDNLESKERPDVVDYETLFNNSESPMNIFLDHKADLLNCKAINHRIPRTLYDMQTYGDYDEAVIQEIYEKMKYDRGSRLDMREIDVNLNEFHVQQRNGVWILTYIEEFNKPMRYEKSTYNGKGFQFSPLVFTNEPGVRYPTSHMRVASAVQQKLDDQASLFLEIVSRVRNQVMINEKMVSSGQRKAIERNETGGIIWTTKDITPGTYQQLVSAAVSNDLPQLMQICQQNLTEILGSDEQMIAGKSGNETLGQDELARVGSKIRESGMQDKVRDWMIDQFQKEGAILKQYSNAQINLQITGKDYYDTETGQKVEDKWASFMTMENPIGAKEYLQGELDYDCNVYEARKPDRKGVQEECLQAIELYAKPEIENAMLQRGVRVRIDKLAEKAGEQFEFIKSSEFMEKLDARQVAAIQTQNILMQSGGQLPQEKSRMDAESKMAMQQQKEVTKPSSVAA